MAAVETGKTCVEGNRMSGIYIPGERLPETLTAMWIFPDGDVAVFGRNEDITKIRKAIPIPDHGRLIDGDALYEKFVLLESEAMGALQTTGIGSVDGIKWSAILTERTGYKFDIVDAPTIIPADKEAETLIGTDMHGGIKRDESGNVIDWGITGPPGDPGPPGDLGR